MAVPALPSVEGQGPVREEPPIQRQKGAAFTRQRLTKNDGELNRDVPRDLDFDFGP